MERICPYLALADDGRTVADGFDPDHHCHALTPPAPLDRARQVQLCLTEAHVRCDRFAAARTAWLAASSGLPRVAPDVAFGRTRLVLEPELAWRGRGRTPAGTRPRAILIAGGGAVLALMIVFAGMSGIFGGAPGSEESASAEPTATASPSVSEVPAPSSAAAEPSPSVAATPTSQPPTPTPAPTPRTYVVVSGDTLGDIARRFGTTVVAIQQANGLTGTDINPGDVLIIP